MSVFDWIDFFMSPYNIFMVGCFAFLLAYFVCAGALYTFGINRRLGLKISLFVAALVGTLFWVAGYIVVIWYNTPLGPPLELKP
jgi:uncharacterized BrkB/YihY/UPF0761 family membrane protein